MSYLTLQKDLERISLKKDLDQALERMVNFEVNRNKDVNEEEKEEFEEEENSYNFVQRRWIFSCWCLSVYKWKRSKKRNNHSQPKK